MSQLLEPEEVADMLGITENNLRVMRQRGTSPYYIKLGNRVKYAPADVMAWLKKNRISYDCVEPATSTNKKKDRATDRRR